jgi:dipeptidyl aminopeptidase/acylaminoacyl peptidase
LIFIHGGGWAGFNPSALRLEVSNSVPYRRAGYATLSVDYPAGTRGIETVEHLYREARARVGSLPICAIGVSAGGQIALMLAVTHPDLRCVIAEAAPTDLPALAREPGGATAYRIAAAELGAKNLARFSPALHLGSIKARLLLVYAADDPLIPTVQGMAMTRVPNAKLIVLPPGPAPFVHTGIGAQVNGTGVSLAAKVEALREEVRFLQASTAH